jgi:hypothetical protein
VDRRFAVGLLAAAATFGIASYLHLDGRIPLGFTTITGENFSRASAPEAVIGAVLAAAAIVVATSSRWARAAALGAVAFADLGVLVGLGFVLTSDRPHIAVDLAYHLTMLAVLTAGLAVIARTGGRSRPGSDQIAAAGQTAHDDDMHPESTGR